MGRRLRADSRGFTLIELVVVITILGVLVAIAVPAISGYVDNARRKGALADARNIQTALVMYKLDNHAYPAAEDIENYAELKNVLRSYLSLPEDERANFMVGDYAPDATRGFCLEIYAKDDPDYTITIYEDEIMTPTTP